MTYFVRLLIVPAFVTIAASGAFAGSATQVAVGLTHSCALTTEGGVLCWGNNYYGQLGDGWYLDRLTPGPPVGLDSGVTAIAVGAYHTCAVTTGGGVACWGRNNAGQLGDGTTTDRFTPTAVSGLASGVAVIVANNDRNCVLTTGGGVVCWGDNGYGQLGDGTTTDRHTPTAVSGLGSGVTAIAAGSQHACALTTGDAIMCWGSNGNGQLGDGTTTQRLTPTAVTDDLPSGRAAIAAGLAHTCAVLTDWGVACWGHNGHGELGDGTINSRLTPRPVSGLGTDVATIEAGGETTCALTTGGDVLCWGINLFGELGDGTTTDRHVPTPVSRLGSRVASIAPFGDNTCAVTATGAAKCWGRNTYGRLGDGTTTDRHVPTRVAGLEGRLETAYDFTGDLKSDVLWRHATRGEVWLWPMDGAARQSETFVRTVPDTYFEIRGLGDQTNDGTADILWRHTVSGDIYVWAMDGATPPDESYVSTVDPSYDIAGTGDFNGNGKSDILWRHQTNGAVWIWLMDRSTLMSEVYMGPVNLSYVVKGLGDLDGNGKADIVWHHPGTGEVWVWMMDGTTQLSQTWVGTAPDTTYQIQAVADFDGDGQADILWWNTARGEVWIWTMNGATRAAQTWVGTVPDTGYRIVGTGDYDGDGKADILWHHATRGEVWVWLMNGPVKVSENYVGTVPDTGYQIVKTK